MPCSGMVMEGGFDRMMCEARYKYLASHANAFFHDNAVAYADFLAVIITRKAQLTNYVTIAYYGIKSGHKRGHFSGRGPRRSDVRDGAIAHRRNVAPSWNAYGPRYRASAKCGRFSTESSRELDGMPRGPGAGHELLLQQSY